METLCSVCSVAGHGLSQIKTSKPLSFD